MVEQLKKYITENRLHDKTVENFWKAFNNWKNEYSKDFTEKFSNIPLDELNVFVHSIGLRSSQWPECDYNHVVVTVLIHYDGRSFGSYRCFFSLCDDVDDDDILEID